MFAKSEFYLGKFNTIQHGIDTGTKRPVKTPNMMMLGREIGLPAELMFGSPGNTGQPEGDQYVEELQTAIEGAHRVARETLKQSQKRMKRDYDVKVSQQIIT